MPSPTNRLLFLVAFAVIPLTALGTFWPALSEMAALGITAIIAAALVDAFTARARLRGIAVSAPELVRLQKDEPGEIEFRVANPGMQRFDLRIGLALPAAFESPVDSQKIAITPVTASARVKWSLTARRRGQFFLDAVYVERASMLGLWAAHTRLPLQCEIRVYPNLAREQKHVAALFLRKQQLGSRRYLSAGQGREYDKLRDYVPGDGVHDVHWKASAKRRQLMTKVYQVEQAQEVYVIVDASRLSSRTVRLADGTETTVLERFASAALIIALAAEQQGDHFGLLTFNDRVLSFVRARNGQAHYDACRDRIYTLQASRVSPDFEELFTFIRLRLRKRALLIFLTALDDPMLSAQFMTASELVSRQHLIVASMIVPSHIQPVFENDEIGSLDDIYRQLGGHMQWQQLRELEKQMSRRGMRLKHLNVDTMSGQLVAMLSQIRSRQLV